MIKFQNKDVPDEQPLTSKVTLKGKINITGSEDYEEKTTRITLTMIWVYFSYASA
ncbi:MAG: hypothetical protein LJE88_04680 [Deltaproteobacteria bacterium]|jgi:hypothetical protein|nr:hypothetical protein [Deltaproteobacteria bacterium]